LSFSVVPGAPLDEARVVTITETDGTLDSAPTAKITELEAFAPKRRNTQGRRAHRRLRGQRGLALAWPGPHPLASPAGGVARALPQEYSDREASGILLDSTVGVVGHGASPVLSDTAEDATDA